MAHPHPHPHPHPHNSSSSLTEPDLDTLALSLYARAAQHTSSAPDRARTGLLRVPWPRRTGPSSSSNSGLAAAVPNAQFVGRGRVRRGSVATDETGGTGGEDSDESDLEDGEGGGGVQVVVLPPEPVLDERFEWRAGEPHHKLSRSQAPYPLSYIPSLLDHDTANVETIARIHASVSYHVFKEGERPRTCLDVGCGTGRWVLEAAEQWPECSFVGIDIAPVQPKISKKSPLFNRIRWVESNFVTSPLPFEDEVFDHVHVLLIAGAVPEKNYFGLFEEITRVLRPGGTFEMIEEDMIFPNFLKPAPPPPRTSFDLSGTASLSETGASSSSSGTASPAPSSGSSVGQAEPQPEGRVTMSELLGLPEEHDHSLLETLYYDVWRSREVGSEPTAYLPMPLGSFLQDVMMTPPLVFPAQPFSPNKRTDVVPRLPRYDTDGLSAFTSALHTLSQQKFTPNEEFHAQHVVDSTHMFGPRALTHVLAMRDALWAEYRENRRVAQKAQEARRAEREEIRKRLGKRMAEVNELPPTIALLDDGDVDVGVGEGSKKSKTKDKEDLIRHHAELVSKEAIRDLDRIVELDNLDAEAKRRSDRLERARSGMAGDEVVVDRVALKAVGGGTGAGKEEGDGDGWTDVTLVVPENGNLEHHEREEFDMLMDRYERDMRYRTQYTHFVAEYLGRSEPRMPVTADEAAWQKRFNDVLADADDTGLTWARMQIFTARKTYRRLSATGKGRG